jgi:hypothetical protein
MIARTKVGYRHLLTSLQVWGDTTHGRDSSFSAYSFFYAVADQATLLKSVISSFIFPEFVSRGEMVAFRAPIKTGYELFLIFLKWNADSFCSYLKNAYLTTHAYIISHNAQNRYSIKEVSEWVSG